MNRIGLAIVIGVVTFLLCLLLGVVFVALGVPVLTQVGKFLQQWAPVIGVLGGLLSYFTGWSPIR